MRQTTRDVTDAVMPALLAAGTTWVSLWAWAGFVESPRGYLVPALGAALLVAAAGALLRLLRAPAVLVLVGQLVVVGAWFTHRHAPETALGGWLPTPASLPALVGVLDEGVVAAQSYAAPVTDSAPQIFPLLVLAGALTALVVDFLACGLRLVPLAGLPLLALYTAPVSILDEGVPWWVFAATAGSFLAMLAHEEGRRLTHWGRSVGRGGALGESAEGEVGAASVRASARRIGVTATGLAVVAPLVIPTLSGGWLSGSGSGGDGDGDAVTITNPMVNLRRDLVRGADLDLVRVRTEGDPRYLRISVLDEFTGATWKPSDRDIPADQGADGLVARPPGLRSSVPRSRVDFEISIAERFGSTWLPTPYPVTTIEVPGDWRYDTDTLDFVSAEDGQDSAGLDYSLTALAVEPSAEDLVAAGPAPRSVFDSYTDLPDGMPSMVADLAREVTAGLDSAYEKAVRLQRWFRRDGDFEYSLDRASGNGVDDLETFLGTGPESRVGYCEQFAASMAVMGRTLGIPSRVAVGFLAPEEDEPGEYVYSAHDLHAWPEMYFEGAGWVTFEPTPGERAPDVPGYTTGGTTPDRPADLPSAQAPTANPEQMQREPDQGQGAAAASDGGQGGRGAGLALLAALVVVGLALGPRVLRATVRRRRWAEARSAAAAAEAGWRELRDLALDLRRRWDDSATLRTTARSLAAGFGATGSPTSGRSEAPPGDGERGPQADPEATAALDRVVHDVERARFARAGGGAEGRGPREIEADVERVAAALRRGAGKQARRFASWLPASLLRNTVGTVTARMSRERGPMGEAGVDRAL